MVRPTDPLGEAKNWETCVYVCSIRRSDTARLAKIWLARLQGKRPRYHTYNSCWQSQKLCSCLCFFFPSKTLYAMHALSLSLSLRGASLVRERVPYSRFSYIAAASSTFSIMNWGVQHRLSTKTSYTSLAVRLFLRNFSGGAHRFLFKLLLRLLVQVWPIFHCVFACTRMQFEDFAFIKWDVMSVYFQMCYWYLRPQSKKYIT